MKKNVVVFIFLISLITQGFAQEKKEYPFIVFPGTLQFFSMEQMDEAYISTSRLVTRGIDRAFENVYLFSLPVSSIINTIWPFFVNAISHEEGHRSILTNAGIGSISQPFYNSHGTAYVDGVFSDTLINFRSNDTPSFIRMYTAGIESDYMIARKEERMCAFGLESMDTVFMDSFVRIMSVIGYYTFASAFYLNEIQPSSFSSWFANSLLALTEEDNELEQDICGLDTLGAVHWMFHPDEPFKRYVQWTDLSEEEKLFHVKRVTMRAMLNILSPILFEKPYFQIGEHIKLTGSMGYTLAPFGDFIDENIYFSYDDIHIGAYVREYENYNTWFPAFGVGIYDYKPLDWITLGLEGHFWMQPENLDFRATSGVPGGAVKLSATMFFPFWQKSDFQMGLNMSLLYKSYGFLPEVESHDELWRFTCGLTLRF